MPHPKKVLQESWPAIFFTLIYLLVGMFLSFDSQNWEFFFYIAVVLVMGGAALVAHKHVNFTRGLLWCLSVWGLLHIAGGLVHIPESWPINGDKYVLYSLWLIPGIFKYDHLVHAYGFGVATWLCWQGLSSRLRIKRATIGLLTLCALAGMGLGALNEIVEFAATLFIADTNVGGYVNTGWDLVSNMIGALTAVTLIRFGRPCR
jgi:uncharacterized membrane protein YjdF